MQNASLSRWIRLVALLGLTVAAGLPAGAAEKSGAWPASWGAKLGPSARVLVKPAQLGAALGTAATGEFGQARVNAEEPRGIASDVYPKAAPAVVIVRVPTGHGTGFVIDPKGWVITNHHVVEDAAFDPTTGASVVDIHMGKLDGRWMRLSEKPLRGTVYKLSKEQDLALIKLEPASGDPTNFPALTLSRESPGPGTECLVIGHPAGGLLWTVRGGEVANDGLWPKDLVRVVMQRLTIADSERAEFASVMAKVPSHKLLLSTCGINPGDSGGPLLDAKGEVIGVSHAIPQADPGTGISLDKFSYHIHLDEVRDFLADRPAKPPVLAPDPWPPGILSHRGDFDKDGTPDALVFGFEQGERPSGIMIDVDQDSPAVKTADDLEKWDFEFALHMGQPAMAFYDSHHGGAIDLVLIDQDGDKKADVRLVSTNGTWSAKPASSVALVDVMNFENPALRERFEAFGK